MVKQSQICQIKWAWQVIFSLATLLFFLQSSALDTQADVEIDTDVHNFPELNSIIEKSIEQVAERVARRINSSRDLKAFIENSDISKEHQRELRAQIAARGIDLASPLSKCKAKGRFLLCAGLPEVEVMTSSIRMGKFYQYFNHDHSILENFERAREIYPIGELPEEDSFSFFRLFFLEPVHASAKKLDATAVAIEVGSFEAQAAVLGDSKFEVLGNAKCNKTGWWVDVKGSDGKKYKLKLDGSQLKARIDAQDKRNRAYQNPELSQPKGKWCVPNPLSPGKKLFCLRGTTASRHAHSERRDEREAIRRGIETQKIGTETVGSQRAGDALKLIEEMSQARPASGFPSRGAQLLDELMKTAAKTHQPPVGGAQLKDWEMCSKKNRKAINDVVKKIKQPASSSRHRPGGHR